MVNVLDENGVRQLAQGIKDNCKEWVKDTRRRKQIIIGRAIRPKSAECEDVENWYAFIKQPRIITYVTEGNPCSFVHIYIRYLYGTYREIEVLEKKLDENFLCIYFKEPDLYCGYRIDRYEETNNSYSVYLTYKELPITLKGTSPIIEWQNGKRVKNKRISIESIKKDLTYYLKNKEHLFKFEYRRIKKRIKCLTVRNAAKNDHKKVVKTKKEVRWLTSEKECGGSARQRLKTGLYKVRDKSLRTPWQTIYVKHTDDKISLVRFK